MTDKFTFADLCAGIGGFRLGIEPMGGKCIFSADVDLDCERTYKANFDHSFDAYNVHSIVEETFPKVDMICAGFPCQPFSIAGKRKGFEDLRGIVFHKIANIANYVQPKVLFLENVPNILSIEKGETFKEILNHLDGIGYNAFYHVLDSANFGIPQSRKRVYIVSFRKDLGITNFNFTIKRHKKVDFKSFISSGDNSIPISDKWQTYIDLYTGKKSIEQIDFAIPKTRRKLERIDVGVDLDDCIFQIRSSGIRALSINKPLPTFAVSVSGGGAMIPVYSKERRHLNLLEMKRLMGFSDFYKFPVSRTSAIKQLANAVCPPVINSIFADISYALGSVSL